MSNVVRLDFNSVEKVIERIEELRDDIDEMCVMVTLKSNEARKIISSKIEDSHLWYGIVCGLAHDYFLHGFSTPLDDIDEE